MKLYLSSYRVPVPEALFELLPKVPIACRVAIVANAMDYKLPQERALGIDEVIVHLAGFGFVSEVIDLRDYDDPQVLDTALQGFELIWLAGGNTFMLRYELRRSGLEQLLPELLAAGMVYGGESAGAIVAGSSLEGFEIADDPDLGEELIWEGLNLVQKILIPHADNPNFIEYIQHMKKRYATNPDALYLNDGQALVVNDDHQKVVAAS